MNLHPYQAAAIARLDQAVSDGARAPLLVAPTGSGKTIIAASLIDREARAGRRAMFLAPRRELIRQASTKLAAFGVGHGIILAGNKGGNLFSQVQVASVDTLRARVDRIPLPDPHVIVIDEAHLYITAIRAALVNRWPDALRIGLTATPCRKDGRGLGTLFDTLLEVESVQALTDAGYLVPARYFSIAEPDLARVRTVAGDYNQDELAQAMAPLVADVPATWLARAGDRRTVVFAVSVAHSVALRDAFIAEGVAAEHVDAGTPTGEREAVFARFASGQTQVLCNCQLATYGFDLPELDCVVLARPTKSLALYLQMLGRGLRTSVAAGKTDCLVLDHSGCVHRFGFATEDRGWTLDGHSDLAARRATQASGSPRELTCPTCSCVFAGGRLCPSCGYYFAPVGREIRTLDGELIEIGKHLPPDESAKVAFFLELLGLASERGYRDGWAAHKYRERHGEYPPWAWNHLPVATPSLETRRWLKSRQIARARSTASHRATA